MARIEITCTDEEKARYQEHAKEKKRSLSNLANYALKRYCDMNKLQREKNK